MKINTKISIHKVSKVYLISILSFLLFCDLIAIDFFKSPIYTLVQYILLLPVILYCFYHIDMILKEHWKVLGLVLGIVFCIVLSSRVNHVDSYNLRAAIYYGALIFTVFMFSAIMGQKKTTRLLLNAGKWYLVLTLMMNDILMIVLPNRFYNINGKDIGTCFLGNKFDVAYAHLMLFFLVVILEKKDRISNFKMGIYTILMIGICKYIDCMTVLLAVGVFWVLRMIVLYTPFKAVLSKLPMFFLCFFVSAVLLILFQGILAITPLQNFIVNVLHRDATLTGRLEVYAYIFQLFFSHKWLGYGYGNTIVKTTSIWYANAQNAFWDFVINYGLVTMIFLILLLIVVVRKHSAVSKMDHNNIVLWISFAMLYEYIFIGMVEIVYGRQFFFYIALLNAICCEVQQVAAQQRE
ncbi:hypothetical protein BHF69_09685 [Anaerostipes sp. 992a]|uniref:O-antigen ligase family protein n=1 Tax=Anaerostipes sp. 992a TaxID=1261637 RepID=UPI000951EFDA|nr:hypothetical protein [Anaerostipes sp. 992a]OLR62926.1 hypothetical protein BHF69_09685 [Anaerostipes sp. 992a]